MLHQTCPLHHGVDQRSTDSAITVGERVDGLELGMGQRCLGKGRRGRLSCESEQVLHERFELIRFNPHVVGTGRAQR